MVSQLPAGWRVVSCALILAFGPFATGFTGRLYAQTASDGDPQERPERVTPQGVTGGVIIGDDESSLEAAADAGVLTGRPTVRPPRRRRPSRGAR